MGPRTGKESPPSPPPSGPAPPPSKSGQMPGVARVPREGDSAVPKGTASRAGGRVQGGGLSERQGTCPPGPLANTRPPAVPGRLWGPGEASCTQPIPKGGADGGRAPCEGEDGKSRAEGQELGQATREGTFGVDRSWEPGLRNCGFLRGSDSRHTGPLVQGAGPPTRNRVLPEGPPLVRHP